MDNKPLCALKIIAKTESMNYRFKLHEDKQSFSLTPLGMTDKMRDCLMENKEELYTALWCRQNDVPYITY